MAKNQNRKVLTTARYVLRCSCLLDVVSSTRVGLFRDRGVRVDVIRSTRGGWHDRVRACCCLRNGADDLMKWGLRAAVKGTVKFVRILGIGYSKCNGVSPTFHRRLIRLL